jgi:hypothetical protein
MLICGLYAPRQAPPWTPEDDQQLIGLVDQIGLKDWCSVAKAIDGRAARQCRERYMNHLKQGIKKGPWSPEEDAAIVEVSPSARV